MKKKLFLILLILSAFISLLVVSTSDECDINRRIRLLMMNGWLDNLGYLPENLNDLTPLLSTYWFQKNSGPGCQLYGTYDCYLFGIGTFKIHNDKYGLKCYCMLHNPYDYFFYKSNYDFSIMGLMSDWELTKNGFKEKGLKYVGERIKHSSLKYLCERNIWNGRTLLMTAIKYGLKDDALLLIDKGVNVNDIDNSGKTALQYALRAFSRSIVKYGDSRDIIEAKSKRMLENYISSFKKSSHIDIEKSRNIASEISLALINKGADISVIGPENRTLLMEAAMLRLPKVVKLMIEKGADVNAKDYWGRSALDMSKQLGYNEISEILVKSGAK